MEPTTLALLAGGIAAAGIAGAAWWWCGREHVTRVVEGRVYSTRDAEMLWMCSRGALYRTPHGRFFVVWRGTLHAVCSRQARLFLECTGAPARVIAESFALEAA